MLLWRERTFGIDLDKCFDEVQKSNMSKLDKFITMIKEKLKGPLYFKPNFKKILNIEIKNYIKLMEIKYV